MQVDSVASWRQALVPWEASLLLMFRGGGNVRLRVFGADCVLCCGPAGRLVAHACVSRPSFGLPLVWDGTIGELQPSSPIGFGVWGGCALYNVRTGYGSDIT